MRHLPAVCLIVPCYNEARRLDVAAVAAAATAMTAETTPGASACTFVLVNDGSTDGTAQMIAARTSERLHLVDLPANVGKAEAIRQGMLYALNSRVAEGKDWIGYWDADMATPLDELPQFIAYAQLADGQVDAVFGSRVQRLGSVIERSYFRHLLGRVFATFASVLLNVRCYDSQCGAKLFRPDVLRAAFEKPFLSRWIFDLEILLRLRDRRVIEYPVRRWRDVRGSKVDVAGQLVPTLRDLLRIRRAYAQVEASRVDRHSDDRVDAKRV